MPLNKLIFLLVTVLALAGGTVALLASFWQMNGGASLPQILMLGLAVGALALGVRYIAPRWADKDDN